MKWSKGKIDDNEGNPMDCWRSDCGRYIISQNIFSIGDWLYETCVIEKGEERFVGEAKTLKGAKALGEEHA